MKPSKLEVQDSVDEGTLYRTCQLQIRQSGIEEIVSSLGRNGFCSLGPGRLAIVDGELMINFCANAGTYDTKVLAIHIEITVPLTEKESNMRDSISAVSSEISDAP